MMMKVGYWWLVAAFVIAGMTGCQKEKNVPDEQKGKESEESITDRMAEEHDGESPEPTEAADEDPDGEVQGEEVTYATIDGQQVTGYLARPEGAETGMPGIIVIHEWWGLNDNIRAMARRLAGEGYAALAVDLYRGEVAEESGRARELMGEAMERKSKLRANLEQAYHYLDGEVESSEIGVIGWCFGGGWSLQTALMLPDEIDASVIYYGELVTDEEKLKELEMPILGHFGSEDEAISTETVREFESMLEELDKDASIHVYEGAQHAFANPSGERYDEEAAEKAWERTADFLDDHLAAEEVDEESGEEADEESAEQ